MQSTECVIDGCDGAVLARKLCTKHYTRMSRSGTLKAFSPARNTPPAERLAARLVLMPNGCMEWTGSRFWTGYGQIKVHGKNCKTHRFAWEVANGPIPDGLDVLHHCDNRPCCNVEHLFLGTHQDNMDDMAAKGRGVSANALKTHCVRGHELTDSNIRINARGARVCVTCGHLHDKARWLGVSTDAYLASPEFLGQHQAS